MFLKGDVISKMAANITATDEEAAASKRMVFYVFSAQKRIFTKFLYLTNFAQHSFPLVLNITATSFPGSSLYLERTLGTRLISLSVL